MNNKSMELATQDDNYKQIIQQIDYIIEELKSDKTDDERKLEAVLRKEMKQLSQHYSDLLINNADNLRILKLSAETAAQEQKVLRGLKLSCHIGDIKKAQYFLDLGANPLVKGKDEIHALHVAIHHNHKKLVLFIIDYITKLNKHPNKKIFSDIEYSPSFIKIRNEFYGWQKKAVSTPLIKLNHDEVVNLSYQITGALMIKPFTAKVVEDYIKEHPNSLYRDVFRGDEHINGVAYKELGFSSDLDPVLHAVIKKQHDDLTSSSLIQRVLFGYCHQGGFGFVGNHAFFEIFKNVLKLYPSDFFPERRFKVDDEGAVIIEEYTEVRKIYDNDHGLQGTTLLYPLSFRSKQEQEEQEIAKTEKKSVLKPEVLFYIVTRYKLKQIDSQVNVTVLDSALYNTDETPLALFDTLRALSLELSEKNIYQLLCATNHFEFFGWPSLSDDLFLEALKHSKTLIRINLNDCKHLTNESLGAFFSSSSSQTITSLSLVNVPGLVTIKNTHFPELLNANLSHCQHLQTVTIDAPILRVLNISDCPEINFEGFNLNAPDLKELIARNLEQLLDEDIINFILKYPKLQNINVSGCHNISKAVKIICEFKDGIDKLISQLHLENNDENNWRETVLNMLHMIYYSNTRSLPDGLTPLHLIARMGWSDKITLSLELASSEKNDPFKIKNKAGKTVLDEAFDAQKYVSMHQLIEAGAYECRDKDAVIVYHQNYLEDYYKDTGIPYEVKLKMYRLPLYSEPDSLGKRPSENLQNQWLFSSIKKLGEPLATDSASSLSDTKYAVVLSLPKEDKSLRLNNNVIKQLIDPLTHQIKRMSDASNNNNIAKSSHSVASVEWENSQLHFKQNPTEPAKDFASQLLVQRIFNIGMPANTLGKIDVWAEGKKIISYPVWISLTMFGKRLDQVLNDAEISLNIENFCRLVILDILMNPGDNSFKNNIYHEGFIYPIDREQMFIEPVIKVPGLRSFFQGLYKVQVKSSLFTLPQMKEKIAISVMEAFLKLKPKELILQWLQDAQVEAESYAALFSETELKEYYGKADNPFTPYRESTLVRFLFDFITIQSQFVHLPSISLLDLVKMINAQVGAAYERALNNPSLSPAKRLELVTDSTQESVTKKLPLQVKLDNVIPTDEEVGKLNRFSPQEAAKEIDSFDATLLNQSNQSMIMFSRYIGKGVHIRADFTLFAKPKDSTRHTLMLQSISHNAILSLELMHCDVLTDDLLIEIISKSPELESLNVTGCHYITASVLSRLTKCCPKLKTLNITSTKMTGDLSGSFPALEVFTFSSCVLLRSVKIIAPHLHTIKGKNCLALQRLDVYSEKLAFININGCVSIDKLWLDVPAIADFGHCQNLHSTKKYAYLDHLPLLSVYFLRKFPEKWIDLLNSLAMSLHQEDDKKFHKNQIDIYNCMSHMSANSDVYDAVITYLDGDKKILNATQADSNALYSYHYYDKKKMKHLFNKDGAKFLASILKCLADYDPKVRRLGAKNTDNELTVINSLYFKHTIDHSFSIKYDSLVYYKDSIRLTIDSIDMTNLARLPSFDGNEFQFVLHVLDHITEYKIADPDVIDVIGRSVALLLSNSMFELNDVLIDELLADYISQYILKAMAILANFGNVNLRITLQTLRMIVDYTKSNKANETLLIQLKAHASSEDSVIRQECHLDAMRHLHNRYVESSDEFLENNLAEHMQDLITKVDENLLVTFAEKLIITLPMDSEHTFVFNMINEINHRAGSTISIDVGFLKKILLQANFLGLNDDACQNILDQLEANNTTIVIRLIGCMTQTQSKIESMCAIFLLAYIAVKYNPELFKLILEHIALNKDELSRFFVLLMLDFSMKSLYIAFSAPSQQKVLSIKDIILPEAFNTSNDAKKSLFSECANQGKALALKWLVQHGIKFELMKSDFIVILREATRLGDLALITYLLDNHIVFPEKDEKGRDTIPSLLKLPTNKDHVLKVANYFKAWKDINVQLLEAILNNNFPEVKRLVQVANDAQISIEFWPKFLMALKTNNQNLLVYLLHIQTTNANINPDIYKSLLEEVLKIEPDESLRPLWTVMKIWLTSKESIALNVSDLDKIADCRNQLSYFLKRLPTFNPFHWGTEKSIKSLLEVLDAQHPDNHGLNAIQIAEKSIREINLGSTPNNKDTPLTLLLEHIKNTLLSIKYGEIEQRFSSKFISYKALNRITTGTSLQYGHYFFKPKQGGWIDADATCQLASQNRIAYDKSVGISFSHQDAKNVQQGIDIVTELLMKHNVPYFRIFSINEKTKDKFKGIDMIVYHSDSLINWEDLFKQIDEALINANIVPSESTEDTLSRVKGSKYMTYPGAVVQSSETVQRHLQSSL